MQNTELRTFGSIDEYGVMYGFFRKGFTYNHCINELWANSIDGKSNNVFNIINNDNIKIIDDGTGMNVDDLNNMFNLYRSNHFNDKSLGVSGLGTKAGTAILSNKTEVKIFTKKNDENDYYLAIVPWDEMYRSKTYINKITYRIMNTDEIEEFKQDRRNNNPSGTTIQFKYNLTLHNVIKSYFDRQFIDSIEPKNHPSIVFGHFDTEFIYIDNTSSTQNREQLQKYNYFELDDEHYYQGKTIETIEHFTKNGEDDRFIHIDSANNCKNEIRKHSRGYNKYDKVSRINDADLNGWNSIGKYTVIIGMRKDVEYFDESNPKIPTAEKIKSDYDRQFLGEDNHDFLAENVLLRNNQVIGTFKLDGIKISSSRGNAETMHKIYGVKLHVYYWPVSTLDNEQDISMGVQENKTQHNGDSLPIPFKRLITYLKIEKSKSIWKYFTDISPTEQTVESVFEAAVGPIVEPGVESAIEPIVEPVVEPAIEPIVEPGVENAIEPIVEPGVETAVEPIVEPGVETAIEPIVEPIVEAAIEPIVEPVVEPAIEPIVEPVVETAIEPIVEPRAINVSTHRRGAVTGEELRIQLQIAIDNLNIETTYTDTEKIQLFNLLSKINNVI
jgi:hypothetical protein